MTARCLVRHSFGLPRARHGRLTHECQRCLHVAVSPLDAPDPAMLAARERQREGALAWLGERWVLAKGAGR